MITHTNTYDRDQTHLYTDTYDRDPTHLDHIRHCKASPSTKYSNGWINRVLIIYDRREKTELETMLQPSCTTFSLTLFLQGYLAHKKKKSIVLSSDPRHTPTVGSWERGVSYE